MWGKMFASRRAERQYQIDTQRRLAACYALDLQRVPLAEFINAFNFVARHIIMPVPTRWLEQAMNIGTERAYQEMPEQLRAARAAALETLDDEALEALLQPLVTMDHVADLIGWQMHALVWYEVQRRTQGITDLTSIAHVRYTSM